MKNNYTVKVRPIAANQLEAHVEFLARKSINAANRVVDDFEKLEIRLKENPFYFSLVF